MVAKVLDPASLSYMIVDVAFAFRGEPDDGVLYRIELRAAADRCAKDMVVLESLIKSFKTTPLP